MEDIKTDSSDILALEGTVRGSRVRIIIIYMDSDKKKSGKITTKIGRYKNK